MKHRSYKFGNVDFIEISGEHYQVTLSNLGASIYEIKCDKDYLVLTPSNYEDFFKEKAYYGKTIGPVANRLKNSEVKIIDRIYRLKPNEHPNILHSGIHGLSNQLFEFEISEFNGGLLVKFKYFAEHLSDGFPGNRKFEISYLVSEDKGLKIELLFSAFSDKKTLFNMTNHTFFSLGEEDNTKLALQIKSDKFIYPSEINLCPIKDEKLLNSLDFNEPKTLDKSIFERELIKGKANGIDHYLYFSGDKKINLSSSRYNLDIETDFEGAQLYSDNYRDNVEIKGTEAKSHRGLAIEPCDSLLVHEPIDVYHRYIIYKFTHK